MKQLFTFDLAVVQLTVIRDLLKHIASLGKRVVSIFSVTNSMDTLCM
jgi:hypothetical protein